MTGSNNYGSRKPLWMQHPDIAKAAANASPSFETFRESDMYEPSKTNFNEERSSSVAGMALFRRYANGQLDVMHAANKIIDAIHHATVNNVLTDLEEAMIAVVFPEAVENPLAARQGDIYLKISSSEKAQIKQLVQKQLHDEASWAAGRGGGNSYPNNKGMP